MKNTMNFNDKDFQNAVATVMADLKANNVKCDTMDDLYLAMNRYVTLSREDFDKYCQQVKEEMSASNNASGELNEMELDSVVGGLPDFLRTTLGAACLFVGVALLCTGVFAAAGAALGATCGMTVIGSATASQIAATSLAGVCVTNAATGAIAGAVAGAISAVPVSLVTCRTVYALSK